MASIVVYDSGVGGLTIYSEIAKQSTKHDITFVSDNEAFPYGTKSDTELIKRVTAVVEKIALKYAPNILVIACNTASTIVLPILREQFAFAIVGVVPAIKPAAQLSKTNKLALLATPATIARPYTDELIQEHAKECDVLRIGSADLVLMAENKLAGRPVDLVLLGRVIQPILEDPFIDVLVLACTHFPLIKTEISTLLTAQKRKLTLLDSGEAVARRVSSILSKNHGMQNKYANSSLESAKKTATFTRDNINDELKSVLDSYGFSNVDYLSISE